MGAEETKAEVPEPVANGTSLPEKSGEAVAEKTEEENNGLKEKAEDKKDNEKVETEKMDEDQEDKQDKESKGLEEEEEELKTEAMEEEKEELKTESMEEESDSKESEKKVEKEENKDEVEEKVDGLKAEEKARGSNREKGSKKHAKVQNSGEKVKEKTKKVKEKKEPERRTPLTDRPVRERKSVERLVASIDKDASREFQIEKGHGTPLKDIPNVAFKLSRRKTDDTFRLLHTILFGRRGKAVQIKSNISRFSGFVWLENEEKQKIKVKEKFDKCNKEKLSEFCDVLDIPITKATTRKEDIVAKLIDFLQAPHATTTVLVAEKDKSSKKRKRVTKSGTTSKRSTKRSQRRSVDTPKSGKKSTPDSEDEPEEEEKEEEENEEEEEKENDNGVKEKSGDEMPEDSESEEKTKSEDESEEDVGKKKKSTKVSSRKKESAGKTKSKKVQAPKSSTTPHKRIPKTSTYKSSKADEDVDKSPRVSLRKKTENVTKEKSSTPTKSTSKEKTGTKVAKGKDKAKEPSDSELRDAICEILKKVDFNTATFTDILKLLAKQFNADLTPRKSSIKHMIQEELTKLADEADDDEDEQGDAEKDETQSAGQEVEA